MSEQPDAGAQRDHGPAGNGVSPLHGRSVDRGHAKDLFRRFVETRSADRIRSVLREVEDLVFYLES